MQSEISTAPCPVAPLLLAPVSTATCATVNEVYSRLGRIIRQKTRQKVREEQREGERTASVIYELPTVLSCLLMNCECSLMKLSRKCSYITISQYHTYAPLHRGVIQCSPPFNVCVMLREKSQKQKLKTSRQPENNKVRKCLANTNIQALGS